MKNVRIVIAVTLLTLLTLSPGVVWGWDIPLSQLDYPGKEVERPINLGKGWVEFKIGFDYNYSDFFFNEDGDRIDTYVDPYDVSVETGGTEYPFRMYEKVVSLQIRYAWSKGFTAGMYFPYIMRHWRSEFNGERNRDSWGDGSFWGTWEIYHRDEGPMISAGCRVLVEVPTGNQSPGRIPAEKTIGAYMNENIFGRGTYSLNLSLLGKVQYSHFAFEGEAGYRYRIPETVQYMIPNSGTIGMMDYGDEIFFKPTIMFQAPGGVTALSYVLFPFITIPYHAIWGGTAEGLAFKTSFDIAKRFGSKAGVRGHLDDVYDEDTGESAMYWWPDGLSDEGMEIWVSPEVVLHINKYCDMAFSARFPVFGENTLAFYPLTSPGQTYSFDLTVHF